MTELEKLVIRRYVGKENYFTRIRKEETSTHKIYNVKVYYSGVQVFELNNNKIIVNKAMLFAKGGKSMQGNGFPELTSEQINTLENLKIKCTIGTTKKPHKITLEPSTAKDTKIVNKTEMQNKNSYTYNKADIDEVIDMITKSLKEFDVILKQENKKTDFYLKNNEISFKKLLKLQKDLVELSSNQKGIKKIDLKEKIDFEVPENFKGENEKKYYEKFLEKIENVMIDRINLYNKVKDFIKSDYKDEVENKELNQNQTPTEKNFQQLLMNSLLTNREIFKNNVVITDNIKPFEMEYSFYDDDIENKKRNSNKGRVDCLLVDVQTNKLIFNELKMGTQVISGPNGIHKHLLDLIVGLENNKKILDEISEYINDYNETLDLVELNQYKIGEKIKLTSTEFWIFCGYQENKEIEYKKSSVKKAIDNIISFNYTEAEVIEKDAYKNYLNYDMKQLIEELSKLHCKVKIYLVSNDYKNFEPYEINDN